MEQTEMLYWAQVGCSNVFAQSIDIHCYDFIKFSSHDGDHIIPRSVVDSNKPYYGKVYFSDIKKLEEYLYPVHEQATEYLRLYKLVAQCEMFLKCAFEKGEIRTNLLWADDVEIQLVTMEDIYAKLKQKPLWLTEYELSEYAHRMKEVG